MDANQHSPAKQVLVYLAALTSPALALFLRLALERHFGELPHYVLLYPVVLLAAMVGGVWAGLLATATSAVLASYWVLPPVKQFKIENTADAVGLVIFCAMGVGISIIAELYHRNRRTVATYQKAQAVRAERRVADARYRMLFDSIDEGFCTIEVLFDESGKPHNWRFLEVNPAFEKHIGLKRAAGKTMLELVPMIEGRWFDIYGKVATTGKPIRVVEYSQVLKRWFDLYAFRVGKPEQHRLAVLFTDITDRKLAEEALLRAEKLASVGRMAAAIAHELNNPLEAVTNLLFLANESEELPESTRKLLETADAELRRMAYITRQSLGFYRESATPALTSVNAVLESALDLLKSKVKSKHAVIEKQWNNDVQVVGIPGELRQVFSNLLANSLDAIQEGGKINLRVTANQHRVRITVADNGKGISTELQQHIFEPFFTTKGTTGTGLGLWVSKEIISKHGGIVQMRSKVQCGTVVSVVLRLPSRDSLAA
jgi:signal transduction histidine kinase